MQGFLGPHIEHQGYWVTVYPGSSGAFQCAGYQWCAETGVEKHLREKLNVVSSFIKDYRRIKE